MSGPGFFDRAAQDASAEGQETSHNFILNNHLLNVEFVDQQGEQHEGKTEFDSPAAHESSSK